MGDMVTQGECQQTRLTARVLSDDKDRRAAEARAEEKLRACARLMDEQQAQSAPEGSIL